MLFTKLSQQLEHSSPETCLEFLSNCAQTSLGFPWDKRHTLLYIMFLSFDSLLLRLNRHLLQAGEPPVSRSVLYRVRELYPLIYPKSSKLSQTGRLAYDEPLLLWLYFALRVHASVGSYRLVLAYMQDLDRRLANQQQRFSDAFPTVSAIDSYFAYAPKIYA